MRRSGRFSILALSAAVFASSMRWLRSRSQTLSPVSGSVTLGDVVEKVLERMAALDAQIPAIVGVGIDVGHRVLFELGGVRFGPLRRAEQAGFFAVPSAIDDRALRPPALFQELAVGARLLELGVEAADRILGAVHPAVMVIAANHPLAGP